MSAFDGLRNADYLGATGALRRCRSRARTRRDRWIGWLLIAGLAYLALMVT